MKVIHPALVPVDPMAGKKTRIARITKIFQPSGDFCYPRHLNHLRHHAAMDRLSESLAEGYQTGFGVPVA